MIADMAEQQRQRQVDLLEIIQKEIIQNKFDYNLLFFREKLVADMAENMRMMQEKLKSLEGDCVNWEDDRRILRF